MILRLINISYTFPKKQIGSQGIFTKKLRNKNIPKFGYKNNHLFRLFRYFRGNLTALVEYFFKKIRGLT